MRPATARAEAPACTERGRSPMDGQTDRPLLPLSITQLGTLRYGQRKARSVQTQRSYNFLQFPVPPGSGPRSRLTPPPLACPLQPHGLAPASGPAFPVPPASPVPAASHLAWRLPSRRSRVHRLLPCYGEACHGHTTRHLSLLLPTRPSSSGRRAESPGCWAGGCHCPGAPGLPLGNRLCRGPSLGGAPTASATCPLLGG